MARVKGIISAGLAAGSVDQGADTEAVIERTRRRSQADVKVRSAGLPSDILPTVAAGAGAGMVFGPVGALIGAGITAHLAKRRRDGIAAYAQASAASAEDVLSRGRSSLDRLSELATTDAERASVDLKRDEFEAAAALASHPQVGAQALLAAQAIAGTLDDEFDDWETERLAAAKVDRDKYVKEADQATAMRNRLESESGAYIDAQRQFTNLEQLLSGDISTVDATSAIFSYAKLVNPGEITTEGDVEVLSAGGGMDAALASRLNNVILGRAYMDETIAAEMMESAKALMRTQREEQISRNMLAQDFAAELGIRESMRRHISIPVGVDATNLVPVPIQRSPLEDGTDTTARQVVDAIVDPFIPEEGIESPAPILNRIADWYSGSGRERRRQATAERQQRRAVND